MINFTFTNHTIPGSFNLFCAAILLTTSLFLTIAEGYNPDDAVAYAEKYWETPNHTCGNYTDCSPWSYWGTSYCGYASHGGDCANFVSQCVLAGGNEDLNQGGVCRGYPCGREEIGADKLQQCLKTYHGWIDLGIGELKAPPPEIRAGDVLMYSNSSGQATHATLVVRVSDGKAYVAAHSSAQYDRIYTYLTDSEHSWYRWLHNPGSDLPDTVNQPTVGRLETADCQVLRGWAQDRNDNQKSIRVRLYFDADTGNANGAMVELTASQSRQYLCELRGYCSLGFTLPTPYSLMDNSEHIIYAYGLDTQDSSATLLNGCPASITCTPEIPAGVKRKISSKQSRIDHWRLNDFHDRIPAGDSLIDAVKKGPAWPKKPQLIKSSSGSDSVWISDNGYLRFISEESLSNWRMDNLTADTIWAKDDIASAIKGPALRLRPCIASSSDSVYYMIDDSLHETSVAGKIQRGSNGLAAKELHTLKELTVYDIKGRIVYRISGKDREFNYADLQRLHKGGSIGSGLYLIVWKEGRILFSKKWTVGR